MRAWEQSFRNVCRKMKANSVILKYFEHRGLIRWNPEQVCENCFHPGIFRGFGIECGKLYERAKVDWCPHCDAVVVHATKCRPAPLHPEEFLIEMKRKLVRSLAVFLKQDEIGEAGFCPICRSQCYKYEFSISGEGPFDIRCETWTVCINSDCNWEGKYSGKYVHSHVLA